MKKLFIFAAVAAMFASCSSENDDYIAQDKPQKIVFESPVMNKTSRAAITGEKYPETESFKVYAKRHTGTYNGSWANNFMDGVTVSMKTEQPGSKKYWAPENDYYWPKNGDMITFAAYSPASLTNGSGCATLTYSPTGLTVTGYELNSSLASQVDLMYAPRVKDKTAVDHALSGSAAASGYYGVDINFKHALSLINFTVKSANSDVVLKKIIVKDAYDKATFNETISDGGTYSAIPAWSDYAFQVESNSTFEVFNGSQTLTETSVGVPSNEAPANLLMIPQAVGTSKVTIEWTYKNGGLTTPVNDDITIDFSKLSIDTWDIGKKYTYNITIDLNRIYFNPTVTDWGNGGAAEVDPDKIK